MQWTLAVKKPSISRKMSRTPRNIKLLLRSRSGRLSRCFCFPTRKNCPSPGPEADQSDITPWIAFYLRQWLFHWLDFTLFQGWGKQAFLKPHTHTPKWNFFTHHWQANFANYRFDNVYKGYVLFSVPVDMFSCTFLNSSLVLLTCISWNVSQIPEFSIMPWHVWHIKATNPMPAVNPTKQVK